MQRIANEPIWRRGNIQRGILDWGQLTPGMIDKPLHSLIPSLYAGRKCELKAEIHPEIRDNSINICRLISAPLTVNRCATLWIKHACAFMSRYISLMRVVNRKLPSSLQRLHRVFVFSPIRYKWHDSKVCILIMSKHSTFIHSFFFSCSLIIRRYLRLDENNNNSWFGLKQHRTFTWTLGSVFFILPTYLSQPHPLSRACFFTF